MSLKHQVIGGKILTIMQYFINGLEGDIEKGISKKEREIVEAQLEVLRELRRISKNGETLNCYFMMAQKLGIPPDNLCQPTQEMMAEEDKLYGKLDGLISDLDKIGDKLPKVDQETVAKAVRALALTREFMQG